MKSTRPNVSVLGRLHLGAIYQTRGAADVLTPSDWVPALLRHGSGDWGLVPEEDKQANNEALENGSRLLSAYDSADGTRFWIITEADRSSTTILLPEEY